MKKIKAEIADIIGAEYLCITTNGTVKKNGEANMGRGNALEASRLLPWIPEKLGNMISEHGSRVHYLGGRIFSFPVEETWVSQADIKLVEKSARQLKHLADEMKPGRIYLPVPGSGGGGLDGKKVESLLDSILDERFILIEKP